MSQVDSSSGIYSVLAARICSSRDKEQPTCTARVSVPFDGCKATITLCEVLTGPLKAQDRSAVRRYRTVFGTWQLVELNADIAGSAARLRASLGLRIAEAMQAASALAINADALVTHDRDFGRVRTLRVLS